MRAAVTTYRRASAIVRQSAGHFWLAARVGGWLCLLPLRWHARGLTAVLEHIGRAGHCVPIPAADIDSTVRVVRRVAALRFFTLPLFPRACLREALALYHVLSRAGQPVEFCVGVMKAGESFIAHSWVSLHGDPITAADRGSRFRVLYSYPGRRVADTAHGPENALHFA